MPAPSSGAKPVKPQIMRRGWQGPPWFNAVLGLFMLGAGVAFFLAPSKGISARDKALLLVGYVVLAGFYLFRAYRAYRQRKA